eukprot:scaffold62860_cov30-Tisochrysis_lutea.AAC.1
MAWQEQCVRCPWISTLMCTSIKPPDVADECTSRKVRTTLTDARIHTCAHAAQGKDGSSEAKASAPAAVESQAQDHAGNGATANGVCKQNDGAEVGACMGPCTSLLLPALF